MQKLHHRSAINHLKPANANMIAEAILNVKAPTRSTIAKYANVTEMTVCRAISALNDSGFIQESLQDKKNSRAQSISVSVAHELNFIVIDLTLDEYTAYLLSSNHKIRESFFYSRNYSIDLYDDLCIFSERAKSVFSKNYDNFSGIAVIYDGKDHDRRAASDAIERCFNCSVTLSLDISDCIENLRRSAIDAHFPAENIYYLNIGNRKFAYFVTDKYTVKSNPQLLLDKDGVRLDDKLSSCIGGEQLYDIIFNVVNAASAMLDAKLYLIESDRFVLGSNMGFSISEKLKLKFSDRRKIFVSDTKPPYYIKGASIGLQKEIIKNILIK